MSSAMFRIGLEDMLSQLPKMELGADDKPQVVVEVDLPPATRDSVDTKYHLGFEEGSAGRVVFRVLKFI